MNKEERDKVHAEITKTLDSLNVKYKHGITVDKTCFLEHLPSNIEKAAPIFFTYTKTII